MTNLGVSGDKHIVTLLRQQIEKRDSFPVLSPDAIKIQSEATKRDPHFSVLASVIRKDPTMTSQILKAANSPFYRGVASAETLKDALMRLGQNEMVNIIMKMIHQQHFRSKNPLIRTYQEQLWRHSVSCASGALWTARYLSLKELIPKAFIAGLLHDMGKLHILTALEKLLESWSGREAPPCNLIDEIMENLHPQLGYHLLKEWHLPEPYRIIARDHHAERYNPSDTLLVIVRVVNALCLELEKDDPAAGSSATMNSGEIRVLGMPDAGLRELKAELEHFRDLKNF